MSLLLGHAQDEREYLTPAASAFKTLLCILLHQRQQHAGKRTSSHGALRMLHAVPRHFTSPRSDANTLCMCCICSTLIGMAACTDGLLFTIRHYLMPRGTDAAEIQLSQFVVMPTIYVCRSRLLIKLSASQSHSSYQASPTRTTHGPAKL